MNKIVSVHTVNKYIVNSNTPVTFDQICTALGEERSYLGKRAISRFIEKLLDKGLVVNTGNRYAVNY